MPSLTLDSVIESSSVAPAQSQAPIPEFACARPPFPEALDSTTLAAFRACPQKAFRTYIQHWKVKSESVHLRAGKAFASGLEVARRAYYEAGQSKEDAEALGVAELMKVYGDFECPPESGKSLERTAGALEFYFSAYPLDSDAATPLILPSGKRAIEFSFAEPLPGILHPETGNPLLYTGRADMIVDFAGGVYIHDDKTTSSLGASWSKQWDLRSQFTAYCWAAGRGALGITPNGVLVRGVSILKTKYDTQQAVADRSAWEVDRWLAQTLRDVKRMLEAWESGLWDYNLDHACADFGGCPLLRVCKSKEPETWLEMDFEQRVWDPLVREEFTAAEYLARKRALVIPE